MDVQAGILGKGKTKGIAAKYNMELKKDIPEHGKPEKWL